MPHDASNTVLPGADGASRADAPRHKIRRALPAVEGAALPTAFTLANLADEFPQAAGDHDDRCSPADPASRTEDDRQRDHYRRPERTARTSLTRGSRSRRSHLLQFPPQERVDTLGIRPPAGGLHYLADQKPERDRLARPDLRDGLRVIDHHPSHRCGSATSSSICVSPSARTNLIGGPARAPHLLEDRLPDAGADTPLLHRAE